MKKNNKKIDKKGGLFSEAEGTSDNLFYSAGTDQYKVPMGEQKPGEEPYVEKDHKDKLKEVNEYEDNLYRILWDDEEFQRELSEASQKLAKDFYINLKHHAAEKANEIGAEYSDHIKHNILIEIIVATIRHMATYTPFLMNDENSNMN